MHLLDRPRFYRWWQGPFARQKLVPLRARLGPGPYGRVLDVACGPGTSTPLLLGGSYRGIDLNPAYVEDGTRRFGPWFEVADAVHYRGRPGDAFDLILVNSFLHHLNDQEVLTVLGNLAPLLAPGGTFQILELVRPSTMGIPRALAALDRGKYARPLERWRALIGERLRVTHAAPYALHLGPLDLWAMVHLEAVTA